MVQTVQLEDTVRRTVSPQVGLSPNMAASSDAFGGQVGRALQGLGAEVSQAASFFMAEQKQRQDFETSTRYIEQQSVNATLLEESARSAEGTTAKDFTKSYMAEVRKRNESFLATVPEGDRPRWKAKLAAAEAQLSQQALTTEFQTYDKFQTAKLIEAQDGFLKGIDQTPDALQTYVQNGEALIEQTNWSDGVKAQKKREWRDNATRAYALARIRQDPKAAARSLGAPGYNVGPANERQSYAMKKIMAAGYTKEQAAGLVGNMIQESGGSLKTTARNPGDGRDGSDSIGILQWNADRAQRLKAYAASKGTSWDDYDTQLEFILVELNTTEKAAGDKLRAARTVEEAAGAAATAYIRPQGSQSGATASHGWKNRRDNALRLAGVDVGQVEVDPNLAGLSYKDTLVLRDAAVQQDQQQTREQTAQQTAAYNEWKNQFFTDIFDGKVGADGIAAARQSGQLVDIDDISRANTLLTQREKDTADYTMFSNKIAASGATWNPFDKADTDAVEAGVKQLGGTPQAAFDVWSKTGILAPSGAVALRGGLISTDQERVLASATLAGNMLASNPNAFAGVTGQADLEKAGSIFNHMVNERGLTPEEAAQRIAQENDPQYRAKIKVTDQAVADFQKDLFKSDQTAAILDAFDPGYLSSEPGMPVLPAQRQALLSDFVEAAADAYRMTGDPEAAKAVATTAIKKQWGVSRGALVKFPPEKAYPSSGSEDDPHGYVYAQAAQDVFTATGKAVASDDVFLAPLPGGQTAESFRQGKLPPYQLVYRHTDPASGQTVFDVLPGKKGFVPDVKKAQDAVSSDRLKKLEEENATARYQAWQDQKKQYDMQMEMQRNIIDMDKQLQMQNFGDYDPARGPQMTPPPDLPPEPPMPPSLAAPPAAFDDMSGVPAPGFTEPFGITP